jgi:hypothetical protein
MEEARPLVEAVLEHLNPSELAGCLEPADVYLTCWEVLSALGDGRASDVLAAATTYLDHMAAAIDDDELRDGFLNRAQANVTLSDVIRQN